MDTLALRLLREYDEAVEAVLLADAAGDELPLHRLDEARGRAWASYTPLSAALRKAIDGHS